ncbi:hypothetical protein OHB04_02210 [Streptomyces sp. NBC_01775]|uniref:hypothetical protein n=1 Tax=Streptomyces sp. NBC_01775 TaxID=2975939 RepID=UPI002DDA52CC|nr:hypothetical protein [Streptomyces sp. NBC_01775]WSB74706.1 hypothetical protein OHB04_02210 [Streptomyces sp. NBC_01775]
MTATEIGTQVTNYDLLGEIEGLFNTRQEAHEAVQTTLSQIIENDGDDVVLSRREMKNGSGRVIGEWLTVSTETAQEIRDAIGDQVAIETN